MRLDRRGRLLWIASAFLAGPWVAAGAGPAGHRPAAARIERAPGTFDAAAVSRQQRALHARLVAAQAAGGIDVPLDIAIDRATLDALRRVDRAAPRLRIGVTRALGAAVALTDLGSVRLAGVPGRRTLGAVRGLPDGGVVWTGAIRSEEASALRLRFRRFGLPAGAALYLYEPAGAVRGPYTGRGPDGSGTFWSHTVPGPLLILQLVVPGTARRGGGAPPAFTIDTVGHLGPAFPLGATPRGEAGSDLCDGNAPCVRNASCVTLPAAIAPARDAVAMIEFVSGRFIYLCSGGLLADTDASSQIPYFLTANHCLSRQREARSLEAFFQFEVPCGGACYDPGGVVPSTLAADVLATDKATDYTLLRLREAPPPGSVFLGWSSAPVAFNDGVPLFRISHPAGSPQAYSEHVVDVNRTTCQSWPRGDRIYSTDTLGATEGGSSGAPVLDAAGEVVGQLSGACGFNVDDPCDAAANATVDGAFAAYFDQVASILAPSAGSTTSTTSTTWATTTTAVSSTTSTTAPGGCAPSGESCVTASECCSGTCRGRPGRRTCK